MTKRLYFISGMVTGAIVLWLFIRATLQDCADEQPCDEDRGKVIQFDEAS